MGVCGCQGHPPKSIRGSFRSDRWNTKRQPLPAVGDACRTRLQVETPAFANQNHMHAEDGTRFSLRPPRRSIDSGGRALRRRALALINHIAYAFCRRHTHTHTCISCWSALFRLRRRPPRSMEKTTTDPHDHKSARTMGRVPSYWCGRAGRRAILLLVLLLLSAAAVAAAAINPFLRPAARPAGTSALA